MRAPLLKSKVASVSFRKIGVRSFNHFDRLLNIDCLEISYKYYLKSYIIQNGISYINDWIEFWKVAVVIGYVS